MFLLCIFTINKVILYIKRKRCRICECECVFAYICCDVCLYDCLSVSVWGVYIMGVYERIANQKGRGEREKGGKEIQKRNYNVRFQPR